MPSLPFSTEQLWAAWERVQENAGCAGVDGVTIAQFGHRAARRIPELLERVAEERYRPYPLLKIVVEKKLPHIREAPRRADARRQGQSPGGYQYLGQILRAVVTTKAHDPTTTCVTSGGAEMRTLLVPTVADRVLQTAVARYLSHSFEEEFLECSYGYRPGRSVDRAIARIRKCHELGYHCVVDADVQSYFDRVDHRLLLQKTDSRPVGPAIHGLLRQWVKAQVWDGTKVHPLLAGVPQGSPISPLLANFYLEDFDREMEKSGRKLVRYADDFLVLAKTPDEAQQALLQTEILLAEAHLKLNEQKTQITDFDHGFRFLGALFSGDATWVPWKYEKHKGRILFMAPPLPAELRNRYELAPPRSAMEAALARTDYIAHSKPAERSNDMAYLYLTEQGSILRKAGDRLIVEKEDEVLLDIPYHKLETVLLFGNVQVTTQAMAELLEKGVALSLFSRQGMYRGSLEPPRGKNIDLRIAQFEWFRDHERAMGAARAIVAAKIANGAAVLDRYRRHENPGADFATRRAAMDDAAAACAGAADIAQLDGVEGAAAREYFAMAMMFNKSDFVWPGRVKHPATDPLNALLSLTYTLLMNEISALLEGAGLDPYLGFLHQIDYGRPSLALDLIEPFRHPVADRLVLKLVNARILEADDFVSGGAGHGTYLAPKPMRRYFEEYERWMLGKAAEGEKARTGFREALRTEVEKLSSALRGAGVFVPWRFQDDTIQVEAASGGAAGCST